MIVCLFVCLFVLVLAPRARSQILFAETILNVMHNSNRIAPRGQKAQRPICQRSHHANALLKAVSASCWGDVARASSLVVDIHLECDGNAHAEPKVLLMTHVRPAEVEPSAWRA